MDLSYFCFMSNSIRYNILFISSWYPNKLKPTAGNFVQNHAEAVSKLHHVEVVHSIGNSDQNERFSIDIDVINGVKTVIVYFRKSRFSVVNFFNKMIGYHKGFKLVNKPDLVHGNVLYTDLFYAVFLKKQHKIPFVVSEHWSLFLQQNRANLNFVKRAIAKVIGNQAVVLLPVSQVLKQNLQMLGIGKRFEIVGNVVDTNVFKIRNHQRDEIHFLHISNLSKIKNADVILKTVIRLKKEGFSVRLSIGGDGDVNSLESTVEKEKMKNYVEIFEHLNQAQIAEKMMDCNFFVLFSSFESQSCVLREALSCGKPVVAPNVGGIPEFVKEGMGKLVEVENEEDLYLSLKEILIGNMSFLKSEEIRKYAVDHFSVESIGSKFSKVYQSVMKGEYE